MNDSKKVVWHLLSNRWNSAITEYALSSIKALNMSGVSNILTCLKGSPALERAKTEGISFEEVDNFSVWNLPRFSKIFSELSPDAIVCYGGPEAFLSDALALIRKHKTDRSRMQNVRSIRFRGADLSGEQSRLKKKLQSFGDSGADQIIVPSMIVKNSLSLNSQKKSIVVPLGIDSKKFFFDAASKKLEGGSNRPEILIFGRLDPVKGHKEFLEIFRKCLDLWDDQKGKSIPKPVLHIAGLEKNVKVSELKKIQKELLIADSDIKFTTEVIESVHELMSHASLGIVCSLGSEIICRVAEEFLLCGTSIFVSGVGGLSEVVLENFDKTNSVQSTYLYKGLGEPKAAELLKTAVMASIMEDKLVSEKRASSASEIYSIQKMGENLLPIILPDTLTNTFSDK